MLIAVIVQVYNFRVTADGIRKEEKGMEKGDLGGLRKR